MFRLPVLLLNSMSKLIHNRCTCKLIIKTLRLYIPVYKRTIASLFHVLIRYSLLFSSEIIIIIYLFFLKKHFFLKLNTDAYNTWITYNVVRTYYNTIRSLTKLTIQMLT